MSSCGVDGAINASPAAYEALGGKFVTQLRPTFVKSKGHMDCHIIRGVKPRNTTAPAAAVMNPHTADQQRTDGSAMTVGGGDASASPARLDALDELQNAARSALLLKAQERWETERDRVRRRVKRRSKDVALDPFTLVFRDAALEARWLSYFADAAQPRIFFSMTLLALFFAFRLARELVLVFERAEAGGALPADLAGESKRAVGCLTYGMVISLCSVAYRLIAARCCGARSDASDASEAPPVAPSALSARQLLHRHVYKFAVLALGVLLVMGGLRSRDATLDAIFFLAVSSNSGAISFLEAFGINLVVAASTVVIAVGTDWYSGFESAHAFFLAVALLGTTMGSAFTEFYARRRFGIAKLTEDEVERNNALLYRMLPVPIANELLRRTGTVERCISESFNDVTILFCDIQGFTVTSSAVRPEQVIAMLNTVFASFDALTEVYGTFKLVTIGDCYVAIAGVPYEDVAVKSSSDRPLADIATARGDMMTARGPRSPMMRASIAPSARVAPLPTPASSISPLRSGDSGNRPGVCVEESPSYNTPASITSVGFRVAAPPAASPLASIPEQDGGEQTPAVGCSPKPLLSMPAAEPAAAPVAPPPMPITPCPGPHSFILESFSSPPMSDAYPVRSLAALDAIQDWAAASEEGRAALEPVQYHAVKMLQMAISMISAVQSVRNPLTGRPIEMRFGLHTGRCVGGVIGTRSFRFDVFGPDVLAANLMEAHGIAGGIVVSQTTQQALLSLQGTKYAIPGLSFELHEDVDVKGLGNLQSYVVRVAGIDLSTTAAGGAGSHA